MKKLKVFILLIIVFFIVQDVSAEGIDKTKYSLTNVVDGKITKSVNDGGFTIGLITEDVDYHLTSCGNTEFLSCSCENDVCTAKILNYGKGYLDVGISNSNYTEYIGETILVDIGIDEYMEYAIAKIPNEIYDTYGLDKFSYLSSILPKDITSVYNCEPEKNGTEICNVELRYGYSKYENGSTITNVETRNKKVTFYNYNEEHIPYYIANLNVGSTYNLTNYYGFYDILLKDYLFVSENDDIATVNQKGIITGISSGRTNVKVYNKKTFSYSIVEVSVKGNHLDDINDILNLVNNKEVEIDVSSFDSIDVYVDDIYDSLGNREEIVNYSLIAYNYITNLFAEKMDEEYKIVYDYDKYETCEDGICNANLCNSNVCNIDFEYYKQDSDEKYTFNVSNFKINLTGLFLNYDYYSVGNPTTVTYYNFLGDNAIVNLEYDENYFEKNSDGDLIPLKIGKTILTITSIANNKTYTSSNLVYISGDSIINDKLSNYLKSLNEIVLPYKSDDFVNVNNLKYLESILERKVYIDVPIDSHSKNFLNVDVICIHYDSCLVKTQLKNENGSHLSGPTYYKHANIIYTNTDTITISNLIKLDGEIEKNYYLSNEDVIKLEANSTPENFYNNLINNIGLNNIFNKYSLTFEVSKKLEKNIKDDIKEFTALELVIKDTKNILYKRNIKVIYNYIITMPVTLDYSEESKVNYLKDYISNIISANVSVELVENNIYKVINGSKSYNLILDTKDKVYFNSITPEKRGMELDLNETELIELSYYPKDGTIGKATFNTLNESIATVDDDGNVIGHKKGFTYIDVGYFNRKTRILVAVNMTVKDVLNTYLDKISNNIVVDYSSLIWNTLEGALENYLSNLINDDMYNLGVHIEEENGKYFVQISNYEEYSDKKEITFELKGIKTNEYTYLLNIGETKDIGLLFTEGDNYNLTFSYSNNGIVHLDHNGKVTGLKKGVTTININDKFYQYYNQINIIVDADSVYNDFKNNIEDMNLYVDGMNLDNFKDLYYISEEVDYQIRENNKNIWDIWDYYDVDCSEVNTTNKCTLDFSQSVYGNYKYKIDVNVNREGIYFNEKEVLLDIDEKYSINYKVYLDDSNMSIESLNIDICNIEDDKIVGISPGVCTVKYSTEKYINYQHFVVDKDGYYEKIDNEINSLPNNISLKIEDKNWHTLQLEDGIWIFETAIFDELDRNHERKYIDKYIREYDLDANDKNKVVISGSPSNYFFDEKTGYYYVISALNFGDCEKKEINITYLGIEDEVKDIINQLKEKLPKEYNMSFAKHLALELSKKNIAEYSELFNYPDFEKELNNICSKCTYLSKPGGGIISPGFIDLSNFILIKYDDIPIYFDEIKLSSRFSVELNSNFTEYEYLETLKSEFLKAYLAAKESVEPIKSIDTYNVKPLSFKNNNTYVRKLNDNLDVTIEKGFNYTFLKPYYTFTVEDYSIAVVVDLKINGEMAYSTKLLDIMPNITEITLDVEDKKQVNVDFSPSDATNKNVVWVSSNESIATVKDGLITAVKVGSCVIKVVSEDGNITKEIKVTVNGSDIPADIPEGIPGDIPIDTPKDVIGDVTGDKVVNISDLVTLRKHLAGKTIIYQDRLVNADLNKDGRTDITDLVNLRKMLAK